MIEHSPNTEVFREKFENVALVYKKAFAGSPWFEDLSDVEVRARLQKNSSKNGFQAFIAEGQNGEVAGALWCDMPTIEELATERGQELASFAVKTCNESNLHNIVWEREVLVDPLFQRQGIATRLRVAFCHI